MIRRIVHMQFEASQVQRFRALFEATKDQIRHFPGCLSLELLQDPADASRLSTLSTWTGPDALERYRASELFRDTWAQTRVLFCARPKAISLLIVSNT